MKYELTGYNIDNLLKTLYNKNIVLYNVNRLAYNHIIFEVADKHSKKVKRYIANFKVKQTLSFFKRLPQIFLNNLGVILGVFFGCLFFLYTSNYTWQIMVYGTKDLTYQEIISVLKENGVGKGKINLQTNEQIEEILLNKYDRIAQVSVIRKGTAIIINLSEKLVYNDTKFEPITAKYNGIITSINIKTGTTNVKVGDYVNAGDILVLPFNLDANNNKISVKPVAEIKAEMFVVGKSELKRKDYILRRTGNTQTEYKYKIFNLNLFSGKVKNSFALFDTFVYNENVSKLLPLSRDVVVFYELEKVEITNDFEQQKSALMGKSMSEAKKQLPVGEIINEQTSTSVVADTMYAISTITVSGVIND